MSLGVERKAQDLAKVQDLLREYRQIELLATEGDPPEYYEFAYHLRGAVTGPGGQPVLENEHRLGVRLSFGYPHLPPSCKPLSPIFHPNVDPDAVQIDDFWQHDRGLDELVLHLGHMLCGKIFDTRNPFNPEAAAWYASRRLELPWDRLVSEQARQAEPVAEKGPSTPSFSVDWDYEKEAGLLQAVDEGAGITTAQEDVEALRKAIADCRFYAADKMLTATTDATVLPDREGIAEYIRSQIHVAEQRRQTARAQEQAGKGAAALRLLEQVAGQITDAPGLDEDIERLKQLAPPAPPPIAPIPPSQADRVEASAPAQAAAAPEVEPAAVPKKVLPLPREVPRGVFLGGAALVAVLLVAIGGWVFWADRSHRHTAEIAWKQAQEGMRKKQFAEAKAAAERSATLLRGLRLPAGQGTQQLTRGVNDLLKSRDLSEGLKGNLLYHGLYLPAETIRILEEGETLIAKAEELEKENRWQEAAGLYDEVLQALGAGGEKTGERTQELRRKWARSKQEAALQGGRAAEANAHWREAAVFYREAGDLAGTLGDSEGKADLLRRSNELELRFLREQAIKAAAENNWREAAAFNREAADVAAARGDAAGKADFERRAAELELRFLREQGRKAADENNWTVAAEHYRQAIVHLDAVGGFSAATREELKRGSQWAHFNQLLAEAKQASEQSAWDVAIKHLDDALAYLRENPRLKEVGADGDKLRRDRLLVAVAKGQQLANEANQQKNRPEELGHLRRILAELDRSEVRRDDNFRLLRQETSGRIATLEHEEEVDRLARHLYDKFNEIFLEAYPTISSSRLVQPKVVFLGQDGKTMLFKLQCVEVNLGRRYRLELQYLYDPATKNWRMAPAVAR
ncbi:MAG: hypothetical protein BWK76_15350 [Desulfobulbaceae bacterium A2]|nr:MAG: hypothetical protein BWK76_15350 [Desulfobulbaceae bacterium A2]